MAPRAILGLLRDSYAEWNEDKASRLAAALAYYTIFSLGPLLVIVIAVAGLVFGEEAARGQVAGQIEGLLGPRGAEAVETAIEVAHQPNSSLLATVLGLVTLVLGATGVFGQLQDALNTIWEVQPRPGRGLMGTIKDRFLSFTMVLGAGFLLLVSLVISAVLAAVVNYLGPALGRESTAFLLQAADFALSFGVTTLLFAVIYRVLPDVLIDWRDVWLGAAFTSLLFTAGKVALGLYLGTAGVGSAYGAAGSLVVLLIWIYYSAQIVLFGAEFTQVYANRYGRRVQPVPGALPLTEAQRAEQGMPRRRAMEPGPTRGQAPGPSAQNGRRPRRALPSRALLLALLAALVLSLLRKDRNPVT